ncbi:MAG TPA: PfkB family carbohydrate kinase, partial [Variovorax sp.]|nr:PfkB family carbohydrate kinase [Variovorax sp.]
VLGAGDAFMAGFLRGWLRGEPLERCCTWANACGALVVSRHGCAPAMASWDELQHFLAHGSPTRRLREDNALEHLHRSSTRTRRWEQLGILAFDHRVQFDELAQQHGAAPGRTEIFKGLVAEAARRVASECDAACTAQDSLRAGMILDSRFGEQILPGLTGQGWWVSRPVELPGSRPLVFEPADALMLEMRRWPAEHVAKCLVSWHPDDSPAMREEQLARLHELQAASIATDHEFLVEVIPPRELPADDSTLARALEQLYQGGVYPDWWKLPPTDATDAWEQIGAVIDRHDPHCRGVLLLGMEASEAVLQRGFQAAATLPLCRGFAVGRSIFGDAATEWFAGRMSDEAVIAQVAQRYGRLIQLWQDARLAAAEQSDLSFNYLTRTAT